MVVLLVLTQMLGQGVDPGGEDSDLNLGRTGIAARRVVVVSAAGRRHAADHKITDLLYLCHAHLQYGVSCWDLWRRIADRYREIRDGCCLTLPIEAELDAIYAAMRRDTPQDWIVSRGEYLSARLMADLLGFEFVDAKDWLLFDAAARRLRRDGARWPQPRCTRICTKTGRTWQVCLRQIPG